MSKSSRRQLTSSLVPIFLFSVLFTVYCQLAVLVFKGAEKNHENTEANSNISKKLIVLDAGHGGEDGGAVGTNGILEKELNLETSVVLETYLRFAGFEIVQTRTEDILLYDRSADYTGRKKMLDLAARLKIAEELTPDLFISIHMNAFPDGRYSGLTVYYSPNDPRSKVAAELMQNRVVLSLQPNNNRELKKAGGNIYLLDRLNCPSILVECGFLSNEEECAKLSTEEYRRKLSLVLFSSISSFFQE